MGIFNKHNVTSKVNLIFLAFCFLLLLSFLVPAYWVGRKILEDNSKSELRAISVQKQLTLEGWLTYTESFIRGISNTSDLSNDLETILAVPDYSPTFQYALNELADDLRSWIQPDTGFEAISIIDQQDGTVIVSTLPDEIGVNASAEPYFINGKLGIDIQNPYISKYLHKPVIRISLPIQTLDKQRKFVLAVRIKLDKIAQIVQRGTDTNSSVDVYLVNKTKQVIVPPRFHPNIAILQDTVNSSPIDNCVQGRSGAVAENDYRGIPVISSYTWLPERELCLIVEKDRQEAYSDIRNFSWNVILSASLALIFALILSLFLSRLITEPVLRLLHQVEMFGKGHLDHPIENPTKDEIGLLSRGFNQMAANLSKSIEETKRAAEEIYAYSGMRKTARKKLKRRQHCLPS